MPNFSATRAALDYESGGATFFPPRFSANRARVRFASGAANFTILASVSTPRIERLQRFEPGNNRGTASLPQTEFRQQLVQQRNAEGIEQAFAQIVANQAALEQALNLAREGIRQATAVEQRVSINGSYTNPTGVVSATSAGVVNVAAHQRVYIDGANTTVSVDAGSLTGFTPGQTITVFYADNTRSGGAVTYQASMMAVSQEVNIHVVGRVTIPQAGDPPATGGGPTAPGYVPPPGGGGEIIIPPSGDPGTEAL